MALALSAVFLVPAAPLLALTTQPAQAAPGSPGTPSAGSVVYQENFENGMGTTPVPLTSYTGAGGETYTAGSTWLIGCNGQIVSFNTPYTTLGNCANTADTSQTRQLAYALGAAAGSADPADNHAVTAYTDNNPGANQVEFQTVNNIPLASASGRFLTFSVDTAAENCQVSAPQYQFSFLDASGAATNVGGIINACSSSNSVNVPAVGVSGAQAIKVGSYTSNGSILFNGSSLGVRMTNANGSGIGNDAAFDNIKILDVTPQLDKSFSPAVAPTGGVSTLTFTVTNTSELAAKDGWSFTDALPAGLKVAAGATGGTCAATTAAAVGGSSIAITNGALNAGEASCTITVPVTSATTGSYTNGPANVTETGLNAPGNATVVFEKPSLSLVKHAAKPVDVNGDGITDAGDTIQYSFTVSNAGDVPVSNVAVNDAKAGAVTCPSPTLAVGASEVCTADAPYTITAADDSAGAVNNTATATAKSPAGVTVTSPPSSTSTPAAVPDPALSVVKSADPATGALTPGEVITYHFVVSNTGNIAIDDVAVDDAGQFSGTGTISAVSCPASSLAAGAQEVCSATYTVTTEDADAGSISNTAAATGVPQGSTTALPPVPSNPVTIPIQPAPAITIVKSATPTVVSKAGQTVNYTFTVKNTGNVTLRNVTVADTGFSGTGTLSAIDCPQTTLFSGQSEDCTAQYVVTQADVNTGTLTNTATATGTPPSGTPLAPVPSNPVTVSIPRTAGLSIVKSANVAAVAVGEKIAYSFAVTNTGNVTVTDPVIHDSGFTGHGQLGPITCPADGTLQPGTTVTCTADYTVVQADIDAGSLKNTATVTGSAPAGVTPPSSTPSTVTVTGKRHASLSVVKTADLSQVTAVGQLVKYAFTVTNTGNVTISDPVVKEGAFTGHGTLSAVDCPSTPSLAPGQVEHCTADYRVVAADLSETGTLSNTATATGKLSDGTTVSSAPSTARVREVDPSVPVVAVNTGGYTLSAAPLWQRLLPLGGLAAAAMALAAGALMWLRRRNQHS